MMICWMRFKFFYRTDYTPPLWDAYTSNDPAPSLDWWVNYDHIGSIRRAIRLMK